jgi:hypothetical protein
MIWPIQRGISMAARRGISSCHLEFLIDDIHGEKMRGRSITEE